MDVIPLLEALLEALLILALCGLIFGVLAKLFACNPNRRVFVSKPIGTDLLYSAFGVLYVGLVPAGTSIATGHLLGPDSDHLRDPIGILSSTPQWAQIALLMIITDFCQYWVHRAFHTRLLWPFHAIHHCATDVNWTTAFRVHPVNYLVTTTFLAICAHVVGFSALTFTAALAHANLNWKFGPLKYALVSPVYHRWHHTTHGFTRDTNFAALLPVWDIVFGTFRLPYGVLPENYGADGIPDNLLGQLLHPFRVTAASVYKNKENRFAPR
jgi:sterol desaturase/sphingolipid hydroxylase (fatty acid hydroxylase superfamily)